MAWQAGEAQMVLSADMSRLKSVSAKATRLMEGMGRKFAAVGQKAQWAFAGLAVGVGYAVKQAADATETMSKFETVFKDQAGAARQFVKTLSDTLGRSRYELAGFMAQAQDTFVPLGYGREEARHLSESLTALTLDLSSFYNKAESDVLQRLTSALVGNHEAVRGFGSILTEARLSQELLNMGIQGGSKAATNQQKVMARLNLIFHDTADAQGDAIRTQDELSNQMRALRGQFQDAVVTLGKSFLPMVRDLTGWLTRVTTTLKNLQPVQITAIKEWVVLGAKMLAMTAVAAKVGRAVYAMASALAAAIVAQTTLNAATGNFIAIGATVAAGIAAAVVVERLMNHMMNLGGATDKTTGALGDYNQATDKAAQATAKLSASLAGATGGAVEATSQMKALQKEIAGLGVVEVVDWKETVRETKKMKESVKEILAHERDRVSELRLGLKVRKGMGRETGGWEKALADAKENVAIYERVERRLDGILSREERLNQLRERAVAMQERARAELEAEPSEKLRSIHEEIARLKGEELSDNEKLKRSAEERIIQIKALLHGQERQGGLTEKQVASLEEQLKQWKAIVPLAEKAKTLSEEQARIEAEREKRQERRRRIEDAAREAEMQTERFRQSAIQERYRGMSDLAVAEAKHNRRVKQIQQKLQKAREKGNDEAAREYREQLGLEWERWDLQEARLEKAKKETEEIKKQRAAFVGLTSLWKKIAGATAATAPKTKAGAAKDRQTAKAEKATQRTEEHTRRMASLMKKGLPAIAV